MGAFDYGVKQTSGIKPNGLLNGSSSLPTVSVASGTVTPYGGVKTLITGAQTASVLSTALNLSGKGSIDFLMLTSIDSFSKTHRVVVTLDGVVVFDSTSSAVGSTSVFFPIIGAVAVCDASQNNYSVVGYPLIFDRSLLIQYASSITETNKTRINVRYTPRA